MLDDGNMGSTKKKHGHGFASKNMYLEIAKSMQKNSLEGRMAFGNAPERKSSTEGKLNVGVFKNLGSKRSIGDILHAEKRR